MVFDDKILIYWQWKAGKSVLFLTLDELDLRSLILPFKIDIYVCQWNLVLRSQFLKDESVKAYLFFYLLHNLIILILCFNVFCDTYIKSLFKLQFLKSLVSKFCKISRWIVKFMDQTRYLLFQFFLPTVQSIELLAYKNLFLQI